MGYPCCCGGPCNICSDNKVPSYLTLTMSGWTDAYINNATCSGATGTTMVSPLSTFNTSIQLDLVKSVSESSPDNCCAVYYGEMSYGTFVGHCGSTVYHDCISSVLTFYSAAYESSNTVGWYASVYSIDASTLFISITTSILAPADELFTACSVGGASGGNGWVVDNEWFCSLTGDSGNLMSIDNYFDTDVATYSHGGIGLLAADACFTVLGRDKPTSVVVSASGPKVRLDPP